MSVPLSEPLVKDLPDPQLNRDARSRFIAGNHAASAGGRARAAKLTRRRRRAIARKGYRAMVARHFGGDRQAQRHYLAQLGIYNYEVMCGSFMPGSPLRTNATHPGAIQDWRARYYTSDLFAGAHRDVEFEHVHSVQHPFYCRHCGWSGSWAGSRCPECGK